MTITAFIQWTPAYSVRNTVLDRQHQFVIEVINELYQARLHRRTALEFRAIFQKLSQYTRTHLAYEEKFLADNGYPEQEAHARLHQAMKIRIHAIEQQNETDDVDISQELFDFLKDWWLTHILEEDMRYAKYFENRSS
ncbi:bacteriohemerythrin [Geoalkalibacter sp.]|uniref:bacteriohemerythrin n=1 Tax=Geoalkalibacter sp. TaxID=3041440 RepID=UPI00272EA0E8|nr:bacteriohemerythrin [Geoalkalibacter sp.]